MLRYVAISCRRGSLILLFIFPLLFFAIQNEGEQLTIRRFKAQYGNARDYNMFRLITMNGHRYILAFWNENNSPLQLSVKIFRYTDEELKEPIFQVFSGSVSEDVTDIATWDLIGNGSQQLIFLSNSGHIKLVRILKPGVQDLQLVFENGGSDVTVVKDQHEIWIKSRTAREVEVFRWDSKKEKFVVTSTHRILF